MTAAFALEKAGVYFEKHFPGDILKKSHAITAEAGTRRYFRPQASELQGWLVVLALNPPCLELQAWMIQQNVRVPQLSKSKQTQSGWAYLVEDFGDIHLCHQPNQKYFQEILAARRKFAAATAAPPLAPPTKCLGAALFEQELQQFRQDWVATQSPNPNFANSAWLTELCKHIAQLAASGPQQWQHRDCHSRNILILENQELGWIDYQDLQAGPVYYDLASLATDAYMDPSFPVADLLHDEVLEVGKTFGMATSQIDQHWYWSRIQRVWKALGTFGRLLNQGRQDYHEAEIRARRIALELVQVSQTAKCFANFHATQLRNLFSPA